MKPKNAPIKKVVVTRDSPAKVEDKPAYVHKVEDTCQSSAVFLASPALQALLGAWVASGDALGANFTKQEVARNTVLKLEEEELSLVLDYDNREAEFASGVQTVAKDDVTIAIAMGMGVKADKAAAVEAVVPTGVRVTELKTTHAPLLAWDEVPGALLYLAQMSVGPATDTSWLSLYGQGRSRKLPPLVSGQQYVLRVCAIDKTGKQTGWSPLVTLTG